MTTTLTIDERWDETADVSPHGAAADRITRIRPPQGWKLLNLHELWQYRELLYFLTWRDVKVRYKQTVLGAAWAILQPLLMMVVFTIFFSRLAGVDSGGLRLGRGMERHLLTQQGDTTAISGIGTGEDLD